MYGIYANIKYEIGVALFKDNSIRLHIVALNAYNDGLKRGIVTHI